MRKEGIARISGFYFKADRRDYIVMFYLIRDLKETIAKFAHGNLLDVGCGNKPYEELFEGKVRTYKGCDVVQSDMNKVDVICEATNLLYSNDTFDTVFSTQVIEHVDDPDRMLKEINRVLVNNGILIMSAPFCWELHEEPYDFYRYSKYGLKSMLEANGFELIEMKANGGKWAAIGQMNLNMIYSIFRKKTFFRRLLKVAFINFGLTLVINKVFLWVDKKFYDEILTLNYVVVAKKLNKNLL